MTLALLLNLKSKLLFLNDKRITLANLTPYVLILFLDETNIAIKSQVFFFH